MKKKNIIIIVLSVISMIALQSCQPKDTAAPTITILGVDGKPLKPSQNDTTILLQSKYTDPGILVEDNKTRTDNIQISSDIDIALPKDKNDGRVNRISANNTDHAYFITYTVTDDAGNSATAQRKIRVVNVSEPFAFLSKVKRFASTLQIKDTTFSGIQITTDASTAGALIFPRVYSRYENGTLKYHPNLKAYLWSDSDTYVDINGLNSDDGILAKIGYLGKRNNPSVPFYEDSRLFEGKYYNMTYQEAKKEILKFQYLVIPSQKSTDGSTTIEGLKDSNGKPLSKVIYVAGAPKTIELVYKVTAIINGVTRQDDSVKETYDKQFEY